MQRKEPGGDRDQEAGWTPWFHESDYVDRLRRVKHRRLRRTGGRLPTALFSPTTRAEAAQAAFELLGLLQIE